MKLFKQRSYEHGHEWHLYRASGPRLLYVMLKPPSWVSWVDGFFPKLRVAARTFRFHIRLCIGRGAGNIGGCSVYFAIRARCNGRAEGYHRFALVRAGITQNANRVPL